MDFAVDLGEKVLVCGGELWRVEQILRQIFDAYGLLDTNIFMLPHTLIITTKDPNHETILRHRSVGGIVVNMDELSQLNTLIRRVVETRPASGELKGMLEETLSGGKHYSKPLTVLGMVIALVSLNYIIGGDWRDAIFVALGISIVMGADMYLSDIPGSNKMVICGLGSFVIGAMDMLAWRAGIVADPYHILVVTAIGLVPGIPLINSCRELLCGRVLGGALLFMTAFMETLFAVCGFAVAISLLGV